MAAFVSGTFTVMAHTGYIAYVGCYTTRKRNGRGRGIEVFRVAADGAWTHLQSVAGPANPSYLHIEPGRNKLYAVHGDGSEISTYALAADGRAELLNTRSTAGTNPVHLSPTPDGRWMVVANYASGNVVSLPMDADGVLGEVTGNLALTGELGPLPAHQKGSHPHMTCFDPSGRWLMVPDKGFDRVFTLKVDTGSGALSVASSMPAHPGAGPRHIAFHPEEPWAYVVGELDGTLIGCVVHPATGALESRQVISCMPENYEDERSSAAIAISPDGAHVYVSNRADHTVAMFRIDQHSGRVALEARLGSWGDKPRFIGVAPGGKTLLVANEMGDNIVEYVLGVNHGNPVERVATGSPVCIVFREA